MADYDRFFRKLDLVTEDPLHGAFGLAWYERKPSSISPEEHLKLMRALREHIISGHEYGKWQEFVK